MSEAAIAELNHNIKQLVAVNLNILKQQQATAVQWMTGVELRKRWKVSERDLIDLLITAIRYAGKKGQPIRVHIEDVLKIDAMIRAKRSTGAL
jgi:hypothetical protein